MTVTVGAHLPEGTLSESAEFDPDTGCPLKPQTHQVSALVKGKKIVVFGVPGAFTPACSAQHLPGYIEHFDQFKAKGIDEIWCMAVNDGFVMAAWGRQQNAGGKVRMMADGSAEYTRKLGLEFDLAGKGLGLRCQRFAMVVDGGVVTALAVEAGGKLDVSRAEAMLARL